jgi:hypothetical protein
MKNSPTTIIAYAKLLLGESVASSHYDVDDLMRLFNEAHKGLVSEARNWFPLLGRQSTSITQTSGTGTTSLPSFNESVLMLRDAGTDWDYADEVYPVDWRSKEGSGFALDDDEILWVNNDQSNTWTLWYTRTIWDCHKGTADSATASTLVLDNTASTLEGDCRYGDAADDYYNTAKALITSCTTAAYTYQESTAATDYTGSTRTLAVTWPAGTPDGTIVYEIQPLLDADQWFELMAWEVALRMMVIGQGEIAQFSRRHPYSQARARFRNHWRNKQRRMRPSLRLAAYDRQ